jgi:hypothetical protein
MTMRCRTAFGGAGGLGVPGPGTGNCLEGAAFAPCGHRLSPQAGGPAAVRRSLPRRPKPSRNFIPAGDAGRRAAAHPRLAGTCPNEAPSLFRSPPPSCRPLASLAGGVEGARAPSSGLRPRLRAHPRGFRGGSPGKRPGSGLPAPTAGWTRAGRPSIPWLCGEFLWEMARMIPDLRENSPETPRPKTPGLGRGRSGPGRSAIPWGQDRSAIPQSHRVPSLASLAPRPSRPRALLLTLLLGEASALALLPPPMPRGLEPVFRIQDPAGTLLTEPPGEARARPLFPCPPPPALVAASPATNNTVNSTANSIANSIANSTARPGGWGSEPPGEARARPLFPRPPLPDPCGRFGHYCLHYC